MWPTLCGVCVCEGWVRSDHPPNGSTSDAKLNRLLAKLPRALADGTISLDQFRVLNHLCSLMLQCNHLSANQLPTDPYNSQWNFIATLLNDDDDERTPPPANG